MKKIIRLISYVFLAIGIFAALQGTRILLKPKDDSNWINKADKKIAILNNWEQKDVTDYENIEDEEIVGNSVETEYEYTLILTHNGNEMQVPFGDTKPSYNKGDSITIYINKEDPKDIRLAEKLKFEKSEDGWPTILGGILLLVIGITLYLISRPKI